MHTSSPISPSTNIVTSLFGTGLKRWDSHRADGGLGVIPTGQPHNGQNVKAGPSGTRTSVPAQPVAKRFYCGQFHDCERSSDTFSKLLAHERVPFAMTTPKEPSIDVLRELCTHERRHKSHDDRPYVCDQCHAKFKYLRLVHRHQAGHNTSRFTKGKSTDAYQNRQREKKRNQRIASEAMNGELDHVSVPRWPSAANFDNDVTSESGSTSDCESDWLEKLEDSWNTKDSEDLDWSETEEGASRSTELALGLSALAFLRPVL